MPPVAPAGSPYNVTVVEIMSDHAMLSWEAPLSHLHNGVIREYLVELTREEGGNGSVVQHTTATTSALVGGLHPDANYSVRIAGHTVETGPYSDPLHLHTLEDGKYTHSLKSALTAVRSACNY